MLWHLQPSRSHALDTTTGATDIMKRTFCFLMLLLAGCAPVQQRTTYRSSDCPTLAEQGYPNSRAVWNEYFRARKEARR